LEICAGLRTLTPFGINLLYGFLKRSIASATISSVHPAFIGCSADKLALKVAVASTALKGRVSGAIKRVGHKPGSVVGNHSSGMRVAAQL
jgi:hypothetical protein